MLGGGNPVPGGVREGHLPHALFGGLGGCGHSCLVRRAQTGFDHEHVVSVFWKAWPHHQAPQAGAGKPPVGCSPFLSLKASRSIL